MVKTRYFMFFFVVFLSLSLVGMALASDLVASPTSQENTNPSGNVSNGINSGSSSQEPQKKPPEFESPPIGLQAGITGVSTDYIWSQTIGTYTEIAGGTQVTTSCDDLPSFGLYTIPFSFTFNGTAYTTFGINCNGFIAMGSIPSSSYTPISGGASNQVISALGNDLQTGAANSEIRYEVLGSSPDQVLVIQWTNFRHYAGAQIYNFQIRLYETSNVVEIVYGAFTETSTNFPQVGLRGNSNADFNNRKGTADWTATVVGTLNSDTVTLSTLYFPPTGLTWIWTPAAPHPTFDASYKTATSQIVIGGTIFYEIHVINTGTGDANNATMVDPLPAGLIYNNDVTCSVGSCGFDGGLNQVNWDGVVPVAGDVTISFSALAPDVPCGVPIVNTATMDDPGLLYGAVARSASTFPIAFLATLQESFDNATFPPAGWVQQYIVGTFNWDRVTSGTSPSILPHSGAAMARWNSYSIGNGNSTRLVSPAVTVAAGDWLKFYMSHDTGYSANADSVTPQISTDGGVTWNDLDAPILRYNAAYAIPGWGEHKYDLADYAGLSVNLGLLAYSAYGNNLFVDDVAIAPPWFPCPYVAIGPNATKTGCVGTVVNYDLQLSNISPDNDIFDIFASGNAWPTIPEPAQLPLDSGGTGQVEVSVQLPVSPGTDVATMTALGEQFGLSGSAILTTNAIEGGWTQIATEPNNGRMDNVLAGYNGRAWSITGYGASALVRYYEPVANTWTEVAGSAPPFGNNYARSGCTYGNTVYMYGDAAVGTFTGLWSYNMDTNTWAAMTPAGTPPVQTSIWAPAWVSDPDTGLCYMTGGAATPGAGTLTTVYVYDPVNNEWLNQLPDFTSVRDFHAAFIYTSPASGDKLLCVAGGNNGVGMTSTQCYDFTLGAWNAEDADLGALPVDMWGMGYADKWHLNAEHQLWLIGGVAAGSLVNTTMYYDVDTGTWLDGGGLISGAIYRTSAVTLNNEIYKLGGSIGSFTYTGLADRHIQCAPIQPPEIEVTPQTLSATQPPDVQTTETLQICNVGGLPLEWSIVELPELQNVKPAPSASNPGGSSTQTPAGYVPTLTRSVSKGTLAGLVGLFKDANPWGSVAWETLMAANSIPFEIHTSAEFASLDFDQFGMIIVACDQPQAFYDTYAANITAFEDYVSGGGFLNFCAADHGWNMGSLDAPLPGGLLPTNLSELNNVINDPAHPLVAGVPSPFNGNSASHAVFSNLPAGANVIVSGENSGLPTMVEYGIGAGWFVAYGQTLEITYDYGWQGAPIVGNAIQYGYNWFVPTDIPWLSEAPNEGMTLPGDCTDVTVTYDSSGLFPGTYDGSLSINSNAVLNPVVNVPVTLTVTSGAIPIYDESFKLAPATVEQGEPIHYTIVISNTGTVAGLATTMTDVVPDGTSFMPGSLTCNSGTCSYNAGTNTVTWLGEVGPGGLAASCSLPEAAPSQWAGGVSSGTVTPGGVIQNIGASTVNYINPDSFSPAGGTVDLCFNITVYSPDAEYMDGFDFDLPDDWTVNSVTDVAGTGCGLGHTFGVNAGNLVYWYTNGMPTGCGEWSNGTYDFCANVTVPPACTESWDLPWNIIGDTYGVPPHSVAGSAFAFCEAPNVYLTPETIDASGCAGVPQDHDFDLLNATGSDTTVDLTYSVTSGSGTCTGPASLDVLDGETVTFTATLNPSGGPGEVVVCEVFAQDALNPNYNDTSVINKTIIPGLTGWEQIATEPNNGRMDNVTASFNGFAWSITGYGGDANVRYYDPAADLWTVVPGSAAPFGGANYARSGCTAGNTVYLYGDASGVMTGLWSYNMESNVWAQVTPSGTPPAQTGIWAPAWVSDPETGYCYMTGGATAPGAGNLTTVYVYDPGTNAWLNPLPNFTSVRDFHAAYFYTSPASGDKLLCVVGGNNGSGMTSTQCYDFTLAAWNAENADMGSLPATGHGLWGIGYSDKWHLDAQHQLWVIGGVDPTGFAVNLTYYFDVDSGTWVDGGNLASGAVYRTSATTVDNNIFHLGGSIGGFTYTGNADRHLQINCPPTITNPVVIEFDAMADVCDATIVNTAVIFDQAIPAPVEVTASTDIACVTEPDITVEPLSLTQTLMPNEQATQQLNICNVGGSPLDWSLSEIAARLGLKVTPPTTSTPASHPVVLNLSSQPGSGQATKVPVVPAADIPFVLDDGSAENNIGITDGTFSYQYIWFNRFTPNPADFPFNLTQVSIFFDAGTGVNVGDDFDLVIYQDADGNPLNGATWLATFPVTVQFTDGVNWSVYDLPSAVLMTGPGDVYIAAINRYVVSGVSPAAFPSALDTNGSQLRSWVGWWNVDPADPPILPPDVSFDLVDNFGFPGNWMVRGLGQTLEPDIPWLSEDPTSGTILPGDCEVVDVTFDSTGLVPATYNGTLEITSNDPDEPVIDVPVELIVIGEPAIVVSPLTLDATVLLDGSTTLPLTISNVGFADLDWNVYDGAQDVGWSDNFDSYPTGTSMHGVGGWKGWANSPAATAYTSDVEAVSVPNSVAIEGASDLVHEYLGYNSGTWTYTAMQFIPTSFTGETYFILLNSYDDAGTNLNWSLEVAFDNATGLVHNDGPAGGSMPMIKGEWVEIREVIDFTANMQSFYYGGDLLFTGSWTEGMSGGGVLNLAAVDLFANAASVVYYDDLSLSQFGDTPWLTENPTSGTTLPGEDSIVDVTFDAAGLGVGVYNTTLFVASNDPATPLVSVPVQMTVVEPQADLSIVKDYFPVDVAVGETFTYTLDVMNLGPQAATNVVVEDTLPPEVTFVSAEGCTEATGVVTCTLASLSPDEGMVFFIVVTANAEGTAVNTATVTSDVLDPDLTNNTSTVETPIFELLGHIYLPVMFKD